MKKALLSLLLVSIFIPGIGQDKESLINTPDIISSPRGFIYDWSLIQVYPTDPTLLRLEAQISSPNSVPYLLKVGFYMDDALNGPLYYEWIVIIPSGTTSVYEEAGPIFGELMTIYPYDPVIVTYKRLVED